MRQTLPFLLIAWCVLGIGVLSWRLALISDFESAGGSVPKRSWLDPWRIHIWGLESHADFRAWLRERGHWTYIRVWWAYWIAFAGFCMLLAATH